MAHRHGAAVRVHEVLVDAEHACGVDRDRREGLVDLDHLELCGVATRPLERALQRQRRDRVQVGEALGRHPVGDDLGDRFETQLGGLLLGHHDERSGAVGDL